MRLCQSSWLLDLWPYDVEPLLYTSWVHHQSIWYARRSHYSECIRNLRIQLRSLPIPDLDNRGKSTSYWYLRRLSDGLREVPFINILWFNTESIILTADVLDVLASFATKGAQWPSRSRSSGLWCFSASMHCTPIRSGSRGPSASCSSSRQLWMPGSSVAHSVRLFHYIKLEH